jgi:zinc transport system substrate-binding protein
LVVSHEAFGYLGDAYQLGQIAVTGLDPESEPSAARISEIVQLAKSENVLAVFTESNANPAVADILAQELGVGVLPLNPIELKPASLDYLVEMEENLLNLTKGLDCS